MEEYLPIENVVITAVETNDSTILTVEVYPNNGEPVAQFEIKNANPKDVLDVQTGEVFPISEFEAILKLAGHLVDHSNRKQAELEASLALENHTALDW